MRLTACRTFLPFFLLVLLAPKTTADPLESASACQGEPSAPLEVHIGTPEGIRPGATVLLSGSVELLAYTPELRITFGTVGPVSIQGSDIKDGPYYAGERVPFEVTASYHDYGKSAVHVHAEVEDGFGTTLYSARTTLYALIRLDKTFTGFGGFLALDRLAVKEDAAKTVSAEAAEEARLDLVRMISKTDDSPLKQETFTDFEQKLNSLIGAPPEGYASPAETDDKVDSAGIAIQGNASWQDENGVYHPVWGATIEIWDDDNGPDEFITALVTDLNGNYSVTVDNDDGLGQGDRDIYVRYRTANTWVNCKNLDGDTYFADSVVSNETPGGSTITANFPFAAGGANDANSVFQAGTWIAAYIAADVEGSALPGIDLIWPNGDTNSFYDGAVNIEEPDRYDWDTVHHEYGHYVADMLDIENNPGGPHALGDCIAGVHGDKGKGTQMAWAEGWPSYFGISGQAEMNMASLNVPRVGDDSYQDVEDGSAVYSLEAQDNNGLGEDNEVAVQRMLWDLYDANADGRDSISRSDNSIWNTIKAANSGPHILSHYWMALRSGQLASVDLLMGEIAADHFIGPDLDEPSDGALVTDDDNSTFEWGPAVGCPNSYSGELFDLTFYNAHTLDKIKVITLMDQTVYSLNRSEIMSLTAVTHDIVWAVEARHQSEAPWTGPYLGESFFATVDLPPEADANGDYVTTEGTDIMLDGTGSSDPDGDPLTYEWDLDNVGGAYDDSTEPTPMFTRVGQDGEFYVHLRVTDPYGLFDTDTTEVEVLNVAPSVSFASNAPRNENSMVTVSGTVSDPGWLDPLTATVDWGDGTPAHAVEGIIENSRPDATLTFSVSHVYGDNGTFTAEVCGYDDDAVTCATIQIQIDNVDPTAEIDETGAVPVNGVPTFFTHAGDPLDTSGDATDPGSDDLLLSWNWDDSSPITSTMYLVNPPAPDPLPSPSIQPRDVTDMKTHTWADACLYEIEFWSDDDDNGTSIVDTANVIIVGNANLTRSAGYWQHQFRAHVTGHGKPHFDPPTLDCYLAITDYMSLVFHEVTDASTFEKAHDVLSVKDNEGDMKELFDRQLLAAWLNFSDGSVGLDDLVDTDGDSVPDTGFGDVVNHAESVRLNPASTDAEIEAQKDILEWINTSAI